MRYIFVDRGWYSSPLRRVFVLRKEMFKMLCTKCIMSQDYGYHKEEVVEPLILEEEDYRTEPEKWNNILELCGFEPNSHVSRIVLNVSTIEYFVEKTQR